MSDYTPTSREVRDAVLMSGKPFDQTEFTDDPYYGYDTYEEFVEPGSAFDRWLAGVRADAWDEGHGTTCDGIRSSLDGCEGHNPYRTTP